MRRISVRNLKRQGLSNALIAHKLSTGVRSVERDLAWWRESYAATCRNIFVPELVGETLIRFHDLRATWATIMLSKGVEPIKVMSMGGWKDIKTMMIYARKAGVDIRGIADCLDLHNPARKQCDVVSMNKR